ncbi:MAG: hypothetical protein NDJ94_18560 [Vicinamibacteria bacterium]|nr:hypothetical protein [Vicinamibacteria bacterium]
MRASRRTGLVAVVLAIAAWYWPASQAWWRLTPVSLASWRENLRMAAIDEDAAAPRVDLPDLELAERLLPRPWVDVDGPAWAGLLRTAREAASQPVESLAVEWRPRVHPREADAAVTFFFRGDEPPFASEAALAPPEAGVAFVRHREAPAQFFEVARVPAGVTAGRLLAWQFRTSRWELPASAAHPYRGASLVLFALAAIALFLVPLLLALSSLGRVERPLDATAPEATLVNTRQRLVVGAFVVAAVGFGLLFLPPAIGLDGMDGGFALQAVALLVTLTAVATGFAFWNSAVRMGRLLSGHDLVARWRYSGLEWRSFVSGEEPRLLDENRALFRLVLGITVLVGLGFVAVAQDEASVVVFGGLMAFMVVLKAISVWVPRERARALARDPGLVLIGRSGLCRAGEFHDWAIPGSALEAAWIEEGTEGQLLGVRYRFVTRYGFDTATVRVPVPGGDRAEGERVARALGPGND